MYDAGSIEATLRILTAEADADLGKIEARVKALEDKAHVIKLATAGIPAASAELAKLEAQVQGLEDKAHVIAFTAATGQASADIAKVAAELGALDKPHVITISAVFQDADIAKARRAFMLLDNAISYDAMQRLRSSPQGSVLGSLNALFSPHPVTGGPSPQQSAAKGLLGQMFSSQGGGTAPVPGAQGGTGTTLRDVVTGTAPQKPPVAGAGTGQPAAAAAAAAGGSSAAADLKAAAAAEATAAGSTGDAASDLKDAAADLKAAAAAGAVSGLQKYLTRSGGAAEAPAAPVPAGGGDAGAAAGTAAAAGALAKLDEQVRKAYEDYAALAGEMNDMRTPAIMSSVPGFRKLDDILRQLDHDLVGLSDPGAATEEALAGIQVRLAGAGLVLDNFEKYIPGTVSGLDALGRSAGAAAGGGGRGGGLTAVGAAAGSSGRAVRGWFGILTATVGGIALWHVALDGVLESAIALTGGLAALTVGLAATEAAAKDIYTHLQAVSTVNSALGSSIPPLTGNFQDLQKAMAPQVIEIFGGALNLVNDRTGVLGQVAGQVVTGIDNLVAKIDLWNASQAHTGQLLKDGVGFLSQFEAILGNVAGAVDHLAKADPGTAHLLLNIAEAGAKLLDWATSIPVPLLATGMALHSVYVWGNFASGALGKVVGLVPGMKGAADVLSHGFHLSALASPAALGITAVVVSVGLLATAWHQADASARAFIGTMNNELAQMTASQAILGITAGLGQLNAKMAQLASPAGMAQLAAQFSGVGHSGTVMGAEAVSALGKIGEGFAALGHGLSVNAFDKFRSGVHDLFSTSAGDSQIAAKMMGDYKAQVDKLLGSQASLYTVTGQVMRGQVGASKATYSYSQALALMDVAGVKAGDSVQLADQKIKNLETGYANVASAGGMLTNSVNAVTFASLQQSSKVSALNSAWDSFLQMVAGGASDFAAFGTDLVTLGKDAGTAGASMTGLNAQSFTLQSGFTSAAAAAGTQMDALTTLASAAGLGQKGTGLLTQANKDLVAALLPAAGQSKTMTTVLYALAQRGGYTGADSFKQLSKWAGNTKNPLLSLQGIVGTLTTAAGNLTTDVQNLSTALGQTLNDAMAQVILTETGGLGPMENLYSAIKTTGLESDTTVGAASALAQQYVQLTGSVSTAHDEFITFAEKALNLNQTAAQSLWNEIAGGLTPAVAGVGTTSVTAATQIENHLISDLKYLGSYTPQVGTDITNFGNAILTTGDASVSTAGARAQLIKDLEAAGVHAGDAATLVNGLQTQIDHLHGSVVNVGIKIAGSGVVTSSVTGLTGIKAAEMILGAASGAYVTGGIPGRDSVLLAAMPGEVVVSKPMVDAGAVDHLRGQIPGFAAGGMVGATAAQVMQQVAGAYSFASGRGSQFASAEGQVFAKAALAQFSHAAAAAAAAYTPGNPAYGGNILQEQQFAASLFSGYGWSVPYEMPALISLWNQESGWNPYAANPTSNARGIPQNINGWSAYAPGDWANQIRWGEDYIHGRYGDPLGAWAHEVSAGWYDRGGYLKPGYTLAFNGTGRNEQVIPAGDPTMAEIRDLLRQNHTDNQQLIQAMKQAPAATGQHVGAAIGGAASSASFRSRYPRNN